MAVDFYPPRDLGYRLRPVAPALHARREIPLAHLDALRTVWNHRLYLRLARVQCAERFYRSARAVECGGVDWLSFLPGRCLSVWNNGDELGPRINKEDQKRIVVVPV